MANNNTLSALVIDDHPLIRDAVTALLSTTTPSFHCTSCNSGQTAKEKLETMKPDLIVCDLTLPDIDGVTLIHELKDISSHAKIIVYTMHDELQFGPLCLKAGASGYVMKGAAISEFRQAINSVMTGQIHVSSSLSQKVMVSLQKSSSLVADPAQLTSREYDIFSLLGQGLGTRQIAEKLNRSTKTIETHRENIKNKLNLQNATELTIAARDWAASHSSGFSPSPRINS